MAGCKRCYHRVLWALAIGCAVGWPACAQNVTVQQPANAGSEELAPSKQLGSEDEPARQPPGYLADPESLPACGNDSSLGGNEASNPFSRLWSNTVAICAIARMEHIADVREWLQYHRYRADSPVHIASNPRGHRARGVSVV